MRVIVCGGRSYHDREAVFGALHYLAETYGWLTIIEGGAKGADRLAREWALLCYHGVVTVEAEWNTLGSAAGSLRNEKMIVSGKPDGVVVFPGGLGTADMKRRAIQHGLPVWEPVA
jgi:predicted Rossmann-fold nucleotide-binding protein